MDPPYRVSTETGSVEIGNNGDEEAPLAEVVLTETRPTQSKPKGKKSKKPKAPRLSPVTLDHLFIQNAFLLKRQHSHGRHLAWGGLIFFCSIWIGFAALWIGNWTNKK